MNRGGIFWLYFIHVVMPAIGIAGFVWLRFRIKHDDWLQVSYFLIFAHYGASIVLVLTALAWYMSGLAAIGMAYLPTLGSIVMIGVAGYMFRRRDRSTADRFAFLLASSYPVIVTMLAIAGILVVKH